MKNEIALEGGLIFKDDKNIIYPSCCADFQEWKENVDSIINKQSPWMGHDPDIGIEFIDNEVIVWSDEPNKSDAFKITYSIKDIYKYQNEIKKSLIHVLKIAENWIEKINSEKKQKFIENLSSYLMI